jgi:hypothetical protein
MEKYHTGYYLKLGTGRFTPKKYSNIFKLDSHLKWIRLIMKGMVGAFLGYTATFGRAWNLSLIVDHLK